MNKTFFILALIIIIAGSCFYFYTTNTTKEASQQQKCPEDYSENSVGTTEYRSDLINWTEKFFESNPEATMSDWSMAKLDLWQKNDCLVALQRAKGSGEVSGLKAWELVDYEVQQSLENY